MLLQTDQRRRRPAISGLALLAGALVVAGFHFGVGWFLVQGASQHPPNAPVPPTSFLSLGRLDDPTLSRPAFAEQIALQDSARLLLPASRFRAFAPVEESLPDPFAPFTAPREDELSLPSPVEDIPFSLGLGPDAVLVLPPANLYGELIPRQPTTFQPVAAPTIEIRAADTGVLLERRPIPLEWGEEPSLVGLWSPLEAAFLVDPVAGTIGPRLLQSTGDPDRDRLLLDYLASSPFRSRLPYGEIRVTVGL